MDGINVDDVITANIGDIDGTDEVFDIEQLDQFISGIADPQDTFLCDGISTDYSTDEHSVTQQSANYISLQQFGINDVISASQSPQWHSIPCAPPSLGLQIQSIIDNSCRSSVGQSLQTENNRNGLHKSDAIRLSTTSQTPYACTATNSNQQGLRVYSLADLLLQPANNSQPQDQFINNQLSAYPYTPPESSSEVNSPPSTSDLTYDITDTENLIDHLLHGTQSNNVDLLPSSSLQSSCQHHVQQAPSTSTPATPIGQSMTSMATAGQSSSVVHRQILPLGQSATSTYGPANNFQKLGRTILPVQSLTTVTSQQLLPAVQHLTPPSNSQTGQSPTQLTASVKPQTVQHSLPTQQPVPAISQSELPTSSQPRTRNSRQNNSRQAAATKENVPICPVNKKRKYSDSPAGSFKAVRSSQSSQVKNEPVNLSDGSDDDDNSTCGQFVQNIRWSNYLQTNWNKLLDKTGQELSTVNYCVEADKGFNFLPHDESFVSQKKNHFQVTVRAGLIHGSSAPQYVVDTESGKTVPIDGFFLHLHGIKMELPTYRIKIEQSLPDRTKHPLHPVRIELNSKDVTKVVIGRLHFSETTTNNMRKRGKPNPDQRYFQLVVSLFAHHANQQYIVASQISDRIIVRASNPGQFDGESELSWIKGKLSDSVYHMGNVGINTDCAEESLTVHGNMQVTGKVISPSDIRAKCDIQELDSSSQLQNISKLKVYSYKFTDEFADFAGLPPYARSDTGVLAQEVREVIPEAVCQTGDVHLANGDVIEDLLVVNKDRIFFENIGAVKELCKVTDKLEMRVNEIEIMNKKLKKLERNSSCKSATSTNSSGKKPIDTDKSTVVTRSAADSSTTTSVGTKTKKVWCRSRIVQITSIILVLIMSACVAAVTALYLLDHKSTSSSISSSNKTTDSSSVTDSVPVSTVAIVSSSCENTPCPVVCCAMSSTLPSTKQISTSQSIQDAISSSIFPSYTTTTATTTITTMPQIVSSTDPLTPLLVAANTTSDAVTDSLHRVKRGSSSDMPTVDIYLLEAHQQLTSSYCQTFGCDQRQTGYSYTYRVPVNSTFPLTALTVEFIVGSADSQVTFELCTEEHSHCADDVVNITDSKQLSSLKWSLPVGFYLNSGYTFRLTTSVTSTLCSSSTLDNSIEFVFNFERQCLW